MNNFDDLLDSNNILSLDAEIFHVVDLYQFNQSIKATSPSFSSLLVELLFTTTIKNV